MEAELNKENTKESKGRIPDILIAIAAKLIELLHNNIDSLKLPKIIKDVLRKLKSFIVKDKKDGKTKMIARIVQDQRRQAARARARAKPAAAVRPPG